MRFAYSRNTPYPALLMPAVLSSVEGGAIFDADAKIDTGADMTIVPEAICKALGLVPVNFVSGYGARGEHWSAIPSYQLRIRPSNLHWFEIVAVSSPNDYVLLGRDVLNLCILRADGPAGYFELNSHP